MPLVRAEGKIFNFPDEATPDEISDALNAQRTPSWGEVIKAVPGAVASGAKKALGGVMQYAGEQGLTDLIPGMELLSPEKRGAARASVGEVGRTVADIANVEEQQNTPDNLTFWKKAVLSGVSSTVSNAPGIAASVATGTVVPALALAGAQALGQTYSTVREKRPDISLERAGVHGAADAVAEAGMELIPMKFLLDAAGGPVLRLITGTIMREVPTEIATTALQDANAKLSHRPDMTWEEFGQDILDTIGATMVGAPLTAGVAKGASSIRTPQRPTSLGPSGEGIYRDSNVAPPSVNVPVNPALTAPITQPADAAPEIQVPNVAAPAANPPVFDVPTTKVDSAKHAEIDALIKEIDEELLTPNEVDAAKVAVAAAEKLRLAPTSPDNAATWGQLGAVNNRIEPDSGATRRQANNAYANINDETPRLQRVITNASVADAIGKTPEQVASTPGSYLLGQATEDRPVGVLHATLDTIEDWRKKYLPDSTFVIGNESLPGVGLGAHANFGPKQHYIVPGVFRKPKNVKNFNPNTQVGIFYTLSHEFGHALVSDRYFGDLGMDLQTRIQAESARGNLSPETIAAIPNDGRRALAQEYASVKGRILDGSLTAQEFVDTWIGPAKAGRQYLEELKVAPDAPATQVLSALAAKEAQVALARGQQNPQAALELFNFDEYMAEQMARHAYEKKWDQTTQLGKYFKDALASLRRFFTDAKKDGLIRPGVAFNEWIAGLSRVERKAKGAKVAVEAKKRVGKAAGKKKAVEGKATPIKGKEAVKKAAPRKGKVTQDNAETDTDEVKAKKARVMVTNMVRAGTIEANGQDFKALNQYIRENDWEMFTDVFQGISGKKVKFSIDIENTPAAPKKLPEDIAQLLLDSHDSINAELRRQEKYDDDPDKALELKFAASGKNALKSLLASQKKDQASIDSTEKWITPQMKADMAKQVERRRGLIEKRVEEFKSLLAYKPGPKAQFDIDNDLDFTSITSHAAGSGLSEESAKKPAVLADAEKEWRTKGWESKYFKAWFGDWKGDPQNSSKVMAGDGKPLPVYHSTKIRQDNKQGFDSFTRGDIGFHFGTVRAAHARALSGYGFTRPTDEDIANATASEYERAKGITRLPVTPYYIIPTTLNIRNPLVISDEDPRMWMSPTGMAEVLVYDGFMTRQEQDQVWEADQALIAQQGINADMRERFQVIRSMLQAKGYDGIVYQNIIEGDTTYVAFEPEQVKSLLGTKTFSRGPNMQFEIDFDKSNEEGAGASNLWRNVRNYMNAPGPFKRALRKLNHIQFHVLQLQQIAHLNPDRAGLQYMLEVNRQFNSDKARWQSTADAVITDWTSPKLGKENSAKIGRALREEQEEGVNWFELKRLDGPGGHFYKFEMTAKAAEELKKRGIDIETEQGEKLAKIVLSAKNALLDQLQGWQDALISIAKNRYADLNPQVLLNAVKVVIHDVHQMRKVPFFPQGRFGNYMLTVEKKAERGWTVVHREAFESGTEWEKARIAAEARKKPDERIRHFEVSEKNFTLLTVPAEFADVVIAELGISETPGDDGSPSAADKLRSMLQPAKTSQFLKTYDLERLKLRGYSKDEARNFAAFTWHNANAIAKVKYRSEFGQAIRQEQAALRLLERSGPEAIPETEKQTRIVNAMLRAREYVMDPGNEMQLLRSAVSIAYLGLNPKTALMNMFGLMTTAADLTTRLGPVQGSRVFLNGMQKALRTIRLTDLNEARKTSALGPEEQQALDRGIAEGHLSQSYAYHLAGVANQGTLWRLPAAHTAARATRGAVDVAMWLFRLTELSTRRATFLAQLEAEKLKPSEDMTDSYSAAMLRTDKLQNDYSLLNRVPFMRANAFGLGPIAPLATIFMSFAQHMAFHGYGGYEVGERRSDRIKGKEPQNAFNSYTAKIWIALLLLAGYEGLPGMENFLDVLEAVWRKIGGHEPIRKKLREVVQSLEVEWLTPGLAAHGLGHNFSFFGALPEVDVSRSIGVGRLFPGTDLLSRSGQDPMKATGQMVFDLFGPLGGFLKFGLGVAASSGDLNKLKEALEKLPGGLGNLYVAYRWSERGVMGPADGQITRDLQSGEIRDLTAGEILAKAAGFQPSIVSDARERNWAKYDQKLYWTSRRSQLLDSVWVAKLEGDREAEADTRKKIAEYNSSIPDEHRSLRIRGSDITQSLRGKRKRQEREEAGLPDQRRLRSIYEEVDRSFD